MHLRARLLVGLLAGMLFVSYAGDVVFCTGCGAAEMECCRPNRTTTERLSATPCCEFQVATVPEHHPATPTSSKARPELSSPAETIQEVVTNLPPLDPSNLAPGPSPPALPSKPLYILNASLLC